MNQIVDGIKYVIVINLHRLILPTFNGFGNNFFKWITNDIRLNYKTMLC